MATNLSFGAQIDAWCRKSEARMAAVAREATQRTVSKAQERIPRDTGFARASVRASLEAMPQIIPESRGKAGQSYNYNSGEITLVLSGMQLGQTAYIGWTASYVPFLELGHSKQAPTGFVGISAMEWPATVSQVVQELKARVGTDQ